MYHQDCSTGKIGYPSFEEGKYALIEHRAKFNHKNGSGPINLYHCMKCDAWHFTSKGEKAAFLSDPEVIKEIDRLSQGFYWENKSR